MKNDTINDIDNRALKNVPRFVWAFAGVSTVLTALLMTNGIFIGQHLNDLMNIYVEEKRVDIHAKSKLLVIVENHNILIAGLKNELKELKEQIKLNTDLSHQAHKQRKN